MWTRRVVRINDRIARVCTEGACGVRRIIWRSNQAARTAVSPFLKKESPEAAPADRPSVCRTPLIRAHHEIPDAGLGGESIGDTTNIVVVKIEDQRVVVDGGTWAEIQVANAAVLARRYAVIPGTKDQV